MATKSAASDASVRLSRTSSLRSGGGHGSLTIERAHDLDVRCLREQIDECPYPEAVTGRREQPGVARQRHRVTTHEYEARRAGSDKHVDRLAAEPSPRRIGDDEVRRL